MVIIKDIHLKVSATVAQEKTKQETLETYINSKVNTMNRKLNKVNTLFLDTLRYSNKTYFFEEIQNQQSKNESLEKQINLLEKRQVLYQKQIEILEKKATQSNQNMSQESKSEVNASPTSRTKESQRLESHRQMDLAMKQLEKQAKDLDMKH